MNPVIVGGAVSAHNLGYGVVGDVEVFGQALTGQVRAVSGSTVLGTLAAGAGVGTKIQINQELPKSAPLVIEINNVADRVRVTRAGFRSS